MSRFLRNAAAAALAAAAIGGVASAANAQSYDRIVVFGDSLSDNGNLYAVTGGTNPLSPPYYQGRFSNGPVFTELLGFTVGRYTAGASVDGSINYAFGGARTDSALSPPGMRNQLLAYLGGGGTFDDNDLVSILGGANNIFQRIEAFAALPVGDPQLASPTGFVGPTALAAAGDIDFLVNQVANAGAGTILVTNLPRLGITPQFNQGPGLEASPLADYAGQTFNSALLDRLTATAAAQPGSNIILMDLYRISDPLAANPGAFGLTNATDRCFDQTTLTVCSNPDGYLYWDGVHPTAAGHRLIAALATDYLYYGDLGAQSTIQAETGYRQREELLDMATEGLSGRAAWTPGMQMTFGLLADSVETDARGPVAAADATGWGGRVGFDYVTSDTKRFGLAASFRTTQVEAGPMEFDVQSFGVDFAGGWRSGDMFVNGVVGGSIDNYDGITRVTALAPIVHSGQTSGASFGARVQGGMWFDMGGIALSPRAAVSFVSTDVNAWIEQGFAAQYSYEDRTLSGTTAEIGLRAEGGGDNLRFWAEGGYRDTLSDGGDPVRVGIAGNPAQVLERDFEEPFGGSLLASAGVDADIGPVIMTVGYRGRFGDAADSHLGAISFTLPLQ